MNKKDRISFSETGNVLQPLGTAVLCLLFFLFFACFGLMTQANAEWTNIGPEGNYGFNFLVVDPANSQIIYSGIRDGGISKSTDGGATWTAINSGLSEFALPYVNCLVIDPTATNTLYAGTGHTGSTKPSTVGGVFKSTNGGATWVPASTGLTDMTVYSLAIDPVHTGTLYAATAGTGIFRTTNGGASWAVLNSGLGAVNYIALDPKNTQILYTKDQKSTDGGATWNPLGQPADLGTRDVKFLVIDPRNSDVLYAETNRAHGLGGALFKSIDGGATWAWIHGTGVPDNIAQGIMNSVVVDTSNSYTIYATAGYWTNCAAAASCGVFKSTDGGATWKNVYSDGTTDYTTLAIAPNNPQTLYFGSNGVYNPVHSLVAKSTDGGKNWSVDPGPANLSVAALAIDPKNPETIYAAAGEWYNPGPNQIPNGGNVYKSVNRGYSWSRIADSIVSTNVAVSILAIDSKTTQTIYAATNGNNTGAIYKSTDGGSKWTATGFTGWVYSLAVDPKNTGVLYANSKKSTDGGKTWTALGSTFPLNASATVFAVAPSDSKTVYAGFWSKGIYVSADGGAKWTPASAQPASTFIYALVIDPKNAQTAYAGTYNGAYKTTDGGSTWNPINSGLPAIGTATQVWALAIDPVNAGTLYAGTEFIYPDGNSYGGGLFKTTDGGGTWNPVTLMNPSVSALAVDPVNPQNVYAGTIGNSIFTTATPVPITGIPKISAVPASLNFGTMKTGQLYQKTVTVKNTGTGDLAIDSLDITPTSSPEFSAAGCSDPVPKGQSCMVTVGLSPSSFGTKTAQLVISSNDPKKPALTVKLSGKAMPPKITVSPAAVNFGTIKTGATPSKTITVKNTGVSDLTVSVSDPADLSFTTVHNNCSGPIVKGGTPCTITVTFDPSDKTQHKDEIDITSNAAATPVKVKLSGKEK